MKTPKQFHGTCIGLRPDDLEAFDDSARQINWRTFKSHVGAEQFREIEQANGVPLSKDWSVSFFKGRWRGREAVCMMQSAIHHIYL